MDDVVRGSEVGMNRRHDARELGIRILLHNARFMLLVLLRHARSRLRGLGTRTSRRLKHDEWRGQCCVKSNGRFDSHIHPLPALELYPTARAPASRRILWQHGMCNVARRVSNIAVIALCDLVSARVRQPRTARDLGSILTIEYDSSKSVYIT